MEPFVRLTAAAAPLAGGQLWGRFRIRPGTRLPALVASRETLAGVTVRFPVSAPRAVALKGIAEMIDVVGIGWQ